MRKRQHAHVGAGQDKQLSARNVEGTDMCCHDGRAILGSMDPVLWQCIVHTSLPCLKSPDVCHTLVYTKNGKSVLLQVRSDPEGSRKLRFPDYVATAQDGGKVVSLTHRPPLPPQGNTPVRISVRG